MAKEVPSSTAPDGEPRDDPVRDPAKPEAPAGVLEPAAASGEAVSPSREPRDEPAGAAASPEAPAGVLEPAAASGEAESPSRVRALAIVLVACAFFLHALHLSGWLIDDAYISFRYANNLASGRGLVFNPGERVEGFTNFAWVMLAALGILAGAPPEGLMPIVGTLCGLGLIGLVTHEAQRLAEEEGRAHPLAGVAAAAVLATSPSFALYAVSGLETVPFALLVTAGSIALVRRRVRAFAGFTVLAFLTRPEAALLGLAGTLGLAAPVLGRDPVRRREALREAATAAGLLAAGVVPYLAWKLWYFGEVLPNTFHAKPAIEGWGVGYVADALPALAGVLVAALFASVPARGGPEKGWRSPRRAALFGLWLLFVAGVVAEGGDVMHGERMLVPSLSLLALAADGIVLRWLSDVASTLASLVRRRRAEGGTPPRPAAAALSVAGALAVCASVPIQVPTTQFFAFLSMVFRGVDERRLELAREIARSGVRSVATLDVGLLGYAAPDLVIVDLGGLTDRTIARSPGYYYDKRPPVSYLAERSPDGFLFTTLAPPRVGPDGSIGIPSHYACEDYVKELPWFAESYTYVASFQLGATYYQHWFRRSDSLPAKSPREHQRAERRPSPPP